jgi:hypothetical protein
MPVIPAMREEMVVRSWFKTILEKKVKDNLS